MEQITEFERKKIFFQHYQDAQKRIYALTEEMEKWGCIATKVNQAYDITGCGNGKGSSKAETGAVNIASILAKINAEIKDAETVRQSVKEAVKKVQKKRYRELLEMRYINGLTPHEISDLYEKDERSIRRTINHAIETLDI